MGALEYIVFVLAVLLLYYLLPRRLQSAVLLFANIFYCLSVSVFCCASVLSVTVSAFFSARSLERKRSRRALALGLTLILSSLVAVKLSSLFGGASGAFSSASGIFGGEGDGTVGLAFYSLSAAGYLIDAYRGKIKPEKSFLRLFLFVGFFPCLQLGPIMRYGDTAPELDSHRAPSFENIVSGVLRISYGYFKKTVIADTAIIAVRKMVASPEYHSGGYALFLIVLYSVVIYADFTGGIDIALGIARALGITLQENFDRPFSSISVREYWKRWHITLGAFFSDYIFYPLSISKPMQSLSRRLRKRGSKKIGRKIPIYIALVITWLLTGAWHGLYVNFLLWGLSNAAIIIASQEISTLSSRRVKKAHQTGKSLAWQRLFAVRTFFIIGAVRLFDLWGDAASAPRAVLSVFYDLSAWKSFFGGGVSSLGLSLPQWLLLAVAVALICAISHAPKRAREKFMQTPLAVTASIALLAAATLVLGSYGVGFERSSFIYSQF